LDGEDPKVIAIIDRLVEALKTPSLSVQTSVAKCLPALMPLPVVGEHHVRLVKQCLTVLAEGDGYGQRKGAAFGLAAMVKGEHAQRHINAHAQTHALTILALS
jgi:hypothetical protein